MLTWYGLNHRPLPWRETQNPYHIWISEIILQQTRVEQGRNYYRRFLDEFPEISDLARADEQAVLKVWQGLGYYSRARNLHKAAKRIAVEFGSEFPREYDQIRDLPGIGDYTAAAIASFAFDQAFAAIDGNVKRWSSRFFGVDVPISKPAFTRLVAPLLQDSIREMGQAGLFNQASIELGSQICTVSKPKCLECPLREECHAFAHNQQEQLPVVEKKKALEDWNLHFLALRFQGELLLVQRPSRGIWAGLYEFPSASVESSGLAFSAVFGGEIASEVQVHSRQSMQHLLSHKRIHATCWHADWTGAFKPTAAALLGRVQQDQNGPSDNSEVWISLSEIDRYPVHRLMQHFLTQYQHD